MRGIKVPMKEGYKYWYKIEKESLVPQKNGKKGFIGMRAGGT